MKSWSHGYFLLCPVAFLTGHPCPGCGMTRAVMATLLGDFEQAFTHHPLGPPLVLVASSALALALVKKVRMRRWGPLSVSRTHSTVSPKLWLLLTGSLLVGVWCARVLGAFGGPAIVHSPLRAYDELRR